MENKVSLLSQKQQSNYVSVSWFTNDDELWNKHNSQQSLARLRSADAMVFNNLWPLVGRAASSQKSLANPRSHRCQSSKVCKLWPSSLVAA
jgi:hypothetical protein